MESGIEYADLRNIRHYLLAAADTHEVTLGMYGSVAEFVAVFEFSDNGIVDEAAFDEVRTAVDDTVTYCFDFAHVSDAAVNLIGENVDNVFCSNSVVRAREFALERSLYSVLVGDTAVVAADALNDTLSDNGTCSGVKQLILERRTARVNN